MTDPESLDQFVEQQLKSGKFTSRDEMVNEGLRLLQERERKIKELRAEIQPALDSLDRGEGEELDIDAVIAAGEKRLAARNGSP